MHLSLDEVLLRIALATVAGLMVGFERESHGRAAGLRTTMLVCVASAIAMILSEYLFIMSGGDTGNWRPDPARLAAGILTGIGFLGAGTIIRQDNAIRGITTAAVLWFVTVLGLTFGSGYLVLGMIGMGIAIIALFILPSIESHVQNDWYGSIFITSDLNGPSEDEIRKKIEELGMKVKKMELDYQVEAKRKTFRYDVKFKKGDLFSLSKKIVQRLLESPGVLSVKWVC